MLLHEFGAAIIHLYVDILRLRADEVLTGQDATREQAEYDQDDGEFDK